MQQKWCAFSERFGGKTTGKWIKGRVVSFPSFQKKKAFKYNKVCDLGDSACWAGAIWPECALFVLEQCRLESLASSCWNPYSSCLKTWTLNHYPAVILCTFLIEIYGMFCLHLIFFFMLLFHYFCSSLHNLFYFKCRNSLILHCCVVMNYVGTKRQQCYSISLWKQKPRDKTQRTMFWFIYAYVNIFYIYSICIHLNLLFAPWTSVLEIAGSKIYIQIHTCC